MLGALVQAQVLTWALPYFGIRGVGIYGPWMLALFLNGVIYGAVKSASLTDDITR